MTKTAPATSADDLLTVGQAVARWPWLGSEKALRSRLFSAEKNGLARAIRRIGGRLFLSATEFENWVQENAR